MAEQDTLDVARRALERAGVNVTDDDVARVAFLLAGNRASNVPGVAAEPALVLVPSEWSKR